MSSKIRARVSCRSLGTQLALVLAGSVFGAPARADEASASANPHNPVAAKLAQLGWLSGSYSGQGLQGRIEEHWTRPAGDSIIGMFRLVGRNDKTQFCELIMIEQAGPHIVGHFRHFGPRLKPWEPLDAPLVLDLVEVTDGMAVFESATGSNPKRLTYHKTSDGGLTIHLQSERNGMLQPGVELSLAPRSLGR